jgi:alginate O-acetyltransferase complex protein AlgI
MLFHSLDFAFFLAVVWLIFQFTTESKRWLLLLLSSIIFYASLRAPLLIIALALVIGVAHFVGKRLATETDETRQRWWLWAGIGANLFILISVKYSKPITSILLPSLVSFADESGLFLTVGVSYFTLQAISYLVDIRLKEIDPEPHLGRLALYFSFFPKLLQGPIERGGDLLPQLRAPHKCSYENLRSGAILFAWGFFKKAAVANRIAAYVNIVYSDVHLQNGISLLIATYLYSVQIYADFSGYTDMALGAARIFNIQLTQNFNAPYQATSVADFWRRWHISFSRWILHYIFEPLQMIWRQAGSYGTAAALFVTFLFSGLWHGASWGFAVWGMLHGAYLAASVLYRPWKPRVHRIMGLQTRPRLLRFFQVCITFNLVTFAWIFFRANTVGDGWYVTTHIFVGIGVQIISLVTNFRHLSEYRRLLGLILVGTPITQFFLMVISASILLAPALFGRHVVIHQQPAWRRYGIYYLLLLAIAWLTVYDDIGFVYFQF